MKPIQLTEHGSTDLLLNDLERAINEADIVYNIVRLSDDIRRLELTDGLAITVQKLKAKLAEQEIRLEAVRSSGKQA